MDYCLGFGGGNFLGDRFRVCWEYRVENVARFEGICGFFNMFFKFRFGDKLGEM